MSTGSLDNTMCYDVWGDYLTINSFTQLQKVKSLLKFSWNFRYSDRQRECVPQLMPSLSEQGWLVKCSLFIPHNSILCSSNWWNYISHPLPILFCISCKFYIQCYAAHHCFTCVEISRIDRWLTNCPPELCLTDAVVKVYRNQLRIKNYDYRGWSQAILPSSHLSFHWFLLLLL